MYSSIQMSMCLSQQKEFTEYLESNGLERSCESSVLETSAVSAVSVTSSVISREARQILSGEVGLSDSMLAVMDGDDPVSATSDPKIEVQASVLTPVSVDSYLSDITEESSSGSNNVSSSDKENCDAGSFVSAKSVLSAYSSASAMHSTQVITKHTNSLIYLFSIVDFDNKHNRFCL